MYFYLLNKKFHAFLNILQPIDKKRLDFDFLSFFLLLRFRKLNDLSYKCYYFIFFQN